MAAGGRYDGLLSRLGAEAAPAVGCMVRPGRAGEGAGAVSLVLAIPSKGRLKEQCEAWLADCGFRLEAEGGARGYRASLSGLPGAEVRLLSAADIAAGVDAGELHLGVTGEDLLRERGEGLASRVLLLRALPFGRADLVVAAPRSWIDVADMSDLADVAHLHLMRNGRRMRVATKYPVQTRAFLARHGVGEYRIVESLGATEGAPAAGQAELVVDITTTGATLAANNLKPVGGGVMLRSRAQLAAGLGAGWDEDGLRLARRLVMAAEARARGRELAVLSWPAEQAQSAGRAAAPFLARGAQARGDALFTPEALAVEAAEALALAGVGPVAVSRPDYVWEAASPACDALDARVTLAPADAGLSAPSR